MKKLLGKVVIGIAGTLAVFGLNIQDVKANVKPDTSIAKVSKTTPLYLTHGKQISAEFDKMISWHQSHYSHSSHESHYSHRSHYSHYSG